MEVVTLFDQLLVINSNKIIEIPFSVDELYDVVVRLVVTDVLQENQTHLMLLDRYREMRIIVMGAVQVRIETEAGVVIPHDQLLHDRWLYERTKFIPGNYKLIITVGEVEGERHCAVTIKALSDLHMKTTMRLFTASTEALSSIQTRLYHKNPTIPIEDATVSVGIQTLDNKEIGTYTLEYKGSGIYASTFSPISGNEYVEIHVLAIGYFNGVAFQRHFRNMVKVFNGQLTFTGPYNWLILHDPIQTTKLTSIVLQVGAEVRQSGKYEVAAWVTGKTGKGKISAGDEFLLEPGKYNLKMPFDVSEFLECIKEPFLNLELMARYNYDDYDCDRIVNPISLPFL